MITFSPKSTKVSGDDCKSNMNLIRTFAMLGHTCLYDVVYATMGTRQQTLPKP